jgi:hypothetical protein
MVMLNEGMSVEFDVLFGVHVVRVQTRKGLGGYGILVDESPWRKWRAKAAMRS